jgi:hypothetical protein
VKPLAGNKNTENHQSKSLKSQLRNQQLANIRTLKTTNFPTLSTPTYQFPDVNKLTKKKRNKHGIRNKKRQQTTQRATFPEIMAANLKKVAPGNLDFPQEDFDA